MISCFKCGRFEHNGAKSPNDIVCTKCAGKHDTNLLNKDILGYVNCLYSNNNYRTNFGINNFAHDSEFPSSRCRMDQQHDSETCAIFKSRIKIY